MGRRTIKVSEGDSDWESGSLLDADERFQTDSEWHAEILEGIQSSQDNVVSLLDDINSNLNFIREYYERNPNPIIIDRTETKPMPTWKFFFSWAMATIIIISAISIIW